MGIVQRYEEITRRAEVHEKAKKEPSLEGFLSLKCGRWDLNPSLSSKTLEKWRVPRIMLSFVPKFVPRMINKKAVSGFNFLHSMFITD